MTFVVVHIDNKPGQGIYICSVCGTKRLPEGSNPIHQWYDISTTIAEKLKNSFVFIRGTHVYIRCDSKIPYDVVMTLAEVMES